MINVIGSVALTPKSRLAITRVRTKAATRPIATPTHQLPRPTRIFSTSLRLRAQRHADADLARPLRDRVAHHAVNSDRCQDQRELAKMPSSIMLKRCRATASETISSMLLMSETGWSLSISHTALRTVAAEAERIHLARDHQRVRREGIDLLVRHVHLHLRLRDEIVLPHVLHHADDLTPRTCRVVDDPA